MPGTTKGFPYPANSDNVDVPGDMQALAEAIDTELDDYLTEASASSTYAPIGSGGSGKQLLYNGAMQVSQRGTSTTSITNTGGYFTADRWNFQTFSPGTWTQSVENDAPTGSGLRKSLKLLCTTAKAALAAGDIMYLAQILEGQDLQRIAKGTASAKKLTLSFWVKANVTGTYVVELRDLDNTRHVAATYSVSASATWEKKTITFPADTTGAFDNDNSASLYVNFYLSSGTDGTSGTLATAWASRVLANAAVGQTNLAAATNNYWQITGVQLEVGDVATDFEFKSFGQELRECQRYYYRQTSSATNTFFGNGLAYLSTNAIVQVNFPVTMRTAPSALEQSGTAGDYMVLNSAGNNVTCNSVPVINRASRWLGAADFIVASGISAGNATFGVAANATAYLGWSAEL